ncbi:sensor histidine kinase [Clostridium lacusfryxellense]|uniref:sensor histidine kinase n=1 Tax=Clostridium lacusfryxellense TaxID=205328 RepID=UPI001FE9F759|nr:ATP-binding protein [Clostridium lacusfryxellense]
MIIILSESNSKNKSRQTMVIGYFSIAFLSLVIILFSIYSMNKVCNESNFIIKKILPAKTFSTEILSSLINQEAAVLSYVISEDKSYLDPYYLGNKQLKGYYNAIGNLKDTKLGVDTTNQLSLQMQSIQTFFIEQIELVESGNPSQAKLNLRQGNDLIEKFKKTDNILINEINIEVNRSRNSVLNSQKTHKYIILFLGILLTLVNLMFINHIWNFMYREIKKENETNNQLQKLLISHEEFIANVSHELKTPLNVIYAAIQLFQMYCYNGSLDDRRQTIIKYLDSMKLNSYRLSKLINNIVDSSKIQAGFFQLHLSNNNIVAIVEEIVMSITNFTDIKGLDIIFDTDVEEKIIACDPEIIQRVVLNLISNAIKFSNVGDEILVTVNDKNEYVEISVKDNGIGIEKDNLNTIFDRFKQVDKSLSRNTEGTGIGLSLVKSLVKLHGGGIYAQSEYGKGSKFIITLPSGIVTQENMIKGNKSRSNAESIHIELSDIY